MSDQSAVRPDHNANPDVWSAILQDGAYEVQCEIGGAGLFLRKSQQPSMLSVSLHVHNVPNFRDSTASLIVAVLFYLVCFADLELQARDQ